jgi:hypothetical protein
VQGRPSSSGGGCWLAVVVAVAAVICASLTRQAPRADRAANPIPSACDPDHIITIQKDCSAYPFDLDPVLPGHTIMFKNGGEVDHDRSRRAITDSIIEIPAGGAGCSSVDLQCAIG